MKAYITGSSGFIGSYFLRDNPDLLAIPHDLIHCAKIFECDEFYFLSAYGNIHTQQDERKTIQANVLDLVHILSEIDWSVIRSFVYFSTSSVKRRVQTMYSRTKKMAEELLLAYMEKYNAPIIIVRPLSVTGTGDKKEHLVPTLIEAAIEGKTMPLVPDAVHDWIDVRDVVAAVKLLVARRVRGIFEVGTGVGRTNEEVLRVVEKVTEKKVHFTFVSNMRAYDSNDWVSTNMRVRQYGWESKIPFEQTIRDMTEAYGSK